MIITSSFGCDPIHLPGKLQWRGLNENATHFVSGAAQAARCFAGFFELAPDGSRRSAT